MKSLPTPPRPAPRGPIAPNSTLTPNLPESGRIFEARGEEWYEISGVEGMAPFLMTLASDSDHWLFLLSNGGLTAGRGNPDRALFPYYTQDKLLDMSGTSGSLTVIRRQAADGPDVWTPYGALAGHGPLRPRRVRKNRLGSRIELEEQHESGIVYRLSWQASERFGFVRQVELENTGKEAVDLEVLDGIRNLVPAGLEQRFQNEFSILGDAYKQAERMDPAHLGIYHLSSVPTDLAEPMESLRATVAWESNFGEATYLLTDRQVDAFRRGGTVREEKAVRGRRGAFLMAGPVRLGPGESKRWYVCADIQKDAREVEELRALLESGEQMETLIEEDCRSTGAGLREKLAAADGFQCSADKAVAFRHTSNTLFNLMRGGTFPTGYRFPKADLRATVRHFNKEAAAELEDLLTREKELHCRTPWKPGFEGGKDLLRLLREYLPLSFSRRHGDPSRPWNRFNIQIRNEDGSPRFAYQGNWRDIFQNWEALLYAYPEYCEATICRFVNASSADGYNPYRLTKDGFEWEVLDPDDPWANIGYWGDHQIIYLLRLLECSIRFHPGQLEKLLAEETFVYAEIPYRLNSFEEILRNPRDTVSYDENWEARIHERVERIGADGKLMPSADEGILYVSFLEKLLVPLLSKMSNFIPGGGIWMNTQRPEWNDANNALVGYGISVVTLGYVVRYLKFLLNEFRSALEGTAYALSNEVVELMESQRGVFASAAAACSPEERMDYMRRLGEPASAYRNRLYESGLGGEKSTVDGSQVIAYLEAALQRAEACLLENRRDDGLWHAYNLLKLSPGGAAIARLQVMLEGQVSVLSSELLDAGQTLRLLESLRASPLYREDQNSYILYPDRKMPGFLEKNKIPRSRAEAIPSLKGMLASGDRNIVSLRPSGEVSFNGRFHNRRELHEALDRLPEETVPTEERQAILELFEDAFNHHSFTGRSGTFFAYEGLGSIYWHMVSKLLLAVQESILRLRETCTAEQLDKLVAIYREIREGIGVHKSPGRYGAFPTDAYSHTPANAGAQQPGMTGQVKEDILVRLGELGLRIDAGRISFDPELVEETEFLEDPMACRFQAVDGAGLTIELEPGSLAYSLCQVPVIYHRGTGASGLAVQLDDGQRLETVDLALNADLSREIFARSGRVRRLDVRLP